MLHQGFTCSIQPPQGKCRVAKAVSVSKWEGRDISWTTCQGASCCVGCSVCRVSNFQHLLFCVPGSEGHNWLPEGLWCSTPCHLECVFQAPLPPASYKQTERCSLVCLQTVPLQPLLCIHIAPAMWVTRGAPSIRFPVTQRGHNQRGRFVVWISASSDFSLLW